ncbi:Retrovirus-related Pol polyprotein from transposon 17.6, partial [Mucuna pruriens]
MDRSMIDAASGGALMDKMPAAARHLISNMASNTQQFGIREPSQTRMVNEIGAAFNQRLENQLTELTSFVRQLAFGQHQPAMAAKVCGICTSVEHPTDMCPTLQETESDQPENVGAIATWETTTSTKTESGAIRSSTIRIHTEYLSVASRLSTADSAISSTIFPTETAIIESAYPSNSPSLEDPMKQLATSNLEFQQFVSSSNMQFQQNMIATIQDLKTIQQPPLSNHSKFERKPSVVTLRSGKELPQPTLQQLPRSAEADSEPNADLQSRPDTTVPLPFPSRTISARKPESDEELLKMRKIKGSREIGGVVSALTRNEEITAGAPTLPKKCRDPGIFSVPCTIGECTFVEAMLDLGASINVMPASIYRSLNFGDLEPTGMTIQLANRSIVQLLGVLKDVLIQVNELIFPDDFYVLDMEDERSGKESTLIMGRPFLMTARTKIDVHAGMLSMEFGDTLVQFNIFEAMKHPIEDHSLFGIDLPSTKQQQGHHEEVQDLPNSEDNHSDIADLDFKVKLSKLLDQVCKQEHLECTNDPEVKVAEAEESPIAQLATIFTVEIKSAREVRVKEEIKSTRPKKINVPSGSDSEAAQEANADSNPTRTKVTKSSRPKHPKAEIMLAHLVPSQNQVDQSDPSPVAEKSPLLPPPMELKPLPSHLKYAYLDREQQLPVIIANNLHQEQQQRGLNPTLLDVVKKEVIKLLATGIIYPISDSQWVSLVQVVPKKSGMTVMKNQQDELVPTRIQNSWRVCIDYRRYVQIHIAPEDQHKTTFTCSFGTFAYTHMPFGLCNAPSTFQRCMTSIFSDLLQECMEVFMDDFTVYADSFEACLSNLSKVLKRCIDTNLVLNFEKCHFMVTEGIVLGHLVSNRGIEVDKAKIDIITSLPNPASVREVRSFLGHASFYKRFIKNFSTLALPLSKLLQKDVEFNFDQPCIEAFQELKSRLTSAPILQAPNWDLPFELMCDASNSALGVVLGQRARVSQPMHVIAYASRTMDPAQQNYITIEKELLAIVQISLSDHVALRYLLKKLDAKLRLIRWMLLLQEFDFQIRDKKGAENSVADHLSRIEKGSELMPIRDEFPDEHLLHIKTATPWFTDIYNYVATSHFPPEASRAYKDKIRSDAKYYIWDDPYLWRLCSDKVIRRCIPDAEINSVLQFCHSAPGGGHYGSTRTARKVLDCGLY